MAFVLYAILLGEVVIGTFFDLIGRTLNPQIGLLLFIAMTGAAFFAGQYVLRDSMKKLRLDLINPLFFNRLSRAIPFILYTNLAIILCMIIQMLTFGSYNLYLLIAITALSGTVGCLLLGFRCYKFLSWYKSNKRNIMILAFAIQTLLLTLGMTSSVVLNTLAFSGKPEAITPEYQVTIDPTMFLSPAERIIELYAYAIPVIIFVIPEMVGIAFFLRYFIDRIGKAKFWVIVTMPPLILLVSTFVPQILTLEQSFAYLDPQFAFFRIIGTLGWVITSFVMAFAFLIIARTIKQVNPHSNVINYLILAAFAEILFPLTANDVILISAYPPFGSILYSFFVLSAFLFSMGIYSAVLVISQDAKLRQLIRKYAKESVPLSTMGTAEILTSIQKRVVDLVKNQADAMTKDSGVESSMTDYDIKQYLESAIAEVKSKNDKDIDLQNHDQIHNSGERRDDDSNI